MISINFQYSGTVSKGQYRSVKLFIILNSGEEFFLIGKLILKTEFLRKEVFDFIYKTEKSD